MTHPGPVFSPPPEPVPFTPDPRAELPATAEVIVIGAGMLGASAAYHLAKAGMKPLVLEANAPASGASGRNAGMVLAGLGGHFPRVTALVREAGGRSVLDYTLRSLDMLEAWDAELPGRRGRGDGHRLVLDPRPSRGSAHAGGPPGTPPPGACGRADGAMLGRPPRLRLARDADGRPPPGRGRHPAAGRLRRGRADRTRPSVRADPGAPGCRAHQRRRAADAVAGAVRPAPLRRGHPRADVARSIPGPGAAPSALVPGRRRRTLPGGGARSV
ncbi:MAG: FAD-binding oxidoreductase [Chloroflexi bacterium]|nr:FAD-binding oxidoreductase [Chloroflexota bacterium]